MRASDNLMRFTNNNEFSNISESSQFELENNFNNPGETALSSVFERAG